MPRPRNLVTLADALGGRLSMRLYPVTGPRVRDALQAPVVEALIRRGGPQHDPTPRAAASVGRGEGGALPSSRVWRERRQPLTTARVPVLRSSRATCDLARRFPATFAATCPTPAGEALAALAHGLPWPGDAIIWSDVTNSATRLLPNPPRSVPFGR